MRADHLHLPAGGPAAYGCADPLLNRLLQGGRIAGALICGEPSSGKTSLLRDMARQLSDGSRGRRYHVAVVDERGELGADRGLPECDVLLYCPKEKGIEQAVRCLAPDVVLFDELGTPEETRAVTGLPQRGDGGDLHRPLPGSWPPCGGGPISWRRCGRGPLTIWCSCPAGIRPVESTALCARRRWPMKIVGLVLITLAGIWLGLSAASGLNRRAAALDAMESWWPGSLRRSATPPRRWGS